MSVEALGETSDLDRLDHTLLRLFRLLAAQIVMRLVNG
jgi:hypothetical protein